MLEEIKEKVLAANLALKDEGLVIHTWGNASQLSADRQHVVIKPSGVNYTEMCAEDMVIVHLATGAKIEGKLKPSSDLMTHLVLYRNFPGISGVVHTHSTHAVAWAQAGRAIPCLGTTHADYFYGEVPLTRHLQPSEIQGQYEDETGKVIVETFQNFSLDPVAIPGVLVNQHGPFTWGKSAADAVYHASVLENIAQMAVLTHQINAVATPAPRVLLDKHYLRKHGADAYYGQANNVPDKSQLKTASA